MKLKNILLQGLSLVLVAALAIGGTVAFLQDDDSDVNVMTLGNVKIEQIEQEWNADQTELVNFTQGKPLYPYVGTLGWENKTEAGGAYRRFTMNNVVDKYVSVKNTGKTEAYVRTIIALEMGEYTDFSEFTMVGLSTNNANGAEFQFDGAWEWTEDFITQIDGKYYNIMVAVHEDPVKPGETTIPSLLQVYLSKDATNEVVEKLDGNNNGTYDILVLSQAVQAAGFDNAKTALDTAFGESSEKAAEWFGGMGKVQFADAAGKKDQVLGEDAAQVLAALEAGNNLIVDKDMDIIGFDTNMIDAKGATVTLAGVGPEAYGYLAFLPDAGEDVTVSNLNVTGSGFVEIGHAGMGGGIYTANNLKIEDLAATNKNGDKGFNLGCAFLAFGDVTLNNCVMTGTTAVQDDTIPVDLGCGQNLKTVINGGEYGTVYCWSHSIVTVDGAKIDTLYTAPINGTVTIKDGTSIDTLNIAYGTSAASAARLAKLVIEDGATIGKIVFSDKNHEAVTFSTVADWNAYVAENFN